MPNRLAALRSPVCALAAALCAISAAQASSPAALQIARTPTSVAIASAGRPVLTYAATPSPMKPYAKTLFTPQGVQILRDSPHDHKDVCRTHRHLQEAIR